MGGRINDGRRGFLKGAGALGASSAMPACATGGTGMIFDPIPPLPQKPTPGKPGDFNFLAGEWRIRNQRPVGEGGAWQEFPGEATCWTILGGVGSVEELRIPVKDFSGLGLRMLDVKAQVWSDFWVNAKSGVLTSPGQLGSFENGVGLFASDFEEEGRAMKSVGVWDQISATTCRWRQATSADGGRTWAHNWIMDWTRA